MKPEHTPETAAAAVRAMFADQIPKNQLEYDEAGKSSGTRWLTAYSAAKLVQEQCNGVDTFRGGVNPHPVSIGSAVDALQSVIPELFADHQFPA